MIHNNIAISVSDIEKSYKNLKVLSKINFTVQKGSIFALLGSNGSGKTTTIKILTTLLKPDKGNAQICGFNVVRESERVREKISLTGQSTAVDEILTGRENLLMIGKLRHMESVNNKVEELLKRFHLVNAADRRVATYSGGMRRKLDLAMSLIGSPEIVFLDEPTTGLDPQGRKAMWEIIKELSNSGVTVFLTTQYLDEADQLADHIAILNHGEIIAEGTSAELKKLVPHGHIELGFRGEKEVELARNLLHEYKEIPSEENQALIISTDGSIKQMSDILYCLQKAEISVTTFSQKPPTLEDVFLTIIGENHEKENDA